MQQSHLNDSSNITNRNHAKEPRCPNPRFKGVISILIHTRESAIFWHHIAVLVAVDLDTDERTNVYQ